MKVCFIAKRYIILAIIPVILVGYFISSNMLAGQTLAGKIIVVDAGHGGIDPGANRPYWKKILISLLPCKCAIFSNIMSRKLY